MTTLRYQGLIAATFTPFHPDGSLNLPVIDRLAEGLRANGINGAFVCGSTGESLSLSTAERMAVAERWARVAGKDLPVIVHVGHNSLPEARGLAAHAQKIGAHSVAAMAPCFFRPACAEDLADFLAAVAAAAPRLPFYYYHIPCRTGVSIPACQILECAAQRIPNLAGVKFTDRDLADMAACIQLRDRGFEVLFGSDEHLLAGLAMGARGAIGTTYNFAAPLFHPVLEAWRNGDAAAAEAAQYRATNMIRLMLEFGGLGAFKAVMAMIDLDCGPVRLPQKDLSPERRRELQAKLEAEGYLQEFLSAVAVK